MKPDVCPFCHKYYGVGKWHCKCPTPGIESDSVDGERWLPIKGYEGKYEVSNMGRVRSLGRWEYPTEGNIEKRWRNGRIRQVMWYSNDRNRKKRRGAYVTLHDMEHAADPKTHSVGRLVWETFVGSLAKNEHAMPRDADPKNLSLPNLVVIKGSNFWAWGRDPHAPRPRLQRPSRCGMIDELEP